MRISPAFVVGALAALLVALFARGAAAHQVGVSRGEWNAEGAIVKGEIAMSKSELQSSFPDLEPQAVDVIGGIDVTVDGATCAGELIDATLTEGDGVIFRAKWTCPHAPESRLAVDAPILADLSLGHRLIARVSASGASNQDVLYVSHATLAVDGLLAPVPPPPMARGVLTFVAMGIEHILGGYDHLLFLVALVLVGGKPRALVATVTAFTVAHSITLAIASLGVWTPSPRVIEPAIALSIAYVGIENFWVKDAANRWRITLPFGLVHGFGFAGALREIELPRAEIPRALLGFNVGVELGQLAVLALVIPALMYLRKKRWFDERVVRALSGAIVVLAVTWFVVRVIDA